MNSIEIKGTCMNPLRNVTAIIGRLVFSVAALIHATPLLANGHPVLAESMDTAAWHVTGDFDEAIFTGDSSMGDPLLVVKKASFTDDPLALSVTSDAPQCVIRSGNDEIRFAVTPGKTTRIILDGGPDRPRLVVDGSESPALRGRWIQLVLNSGQPTLSIQLVNATYATVRFGGPRVEVRRYTMSEPGKPPTLVEENPRSSAVSTIDKVDPPIGSDAELTKWTPYVAAGVDFLTAYFYRGIGQEDGDLIVQPWVEVTVNMIQDDVAPWLDGVDLQTSARSSHHFGATGNNGLSGNREKFYELDFRGSGTARVFERWSLGLAYMFRVAINDQIFDVQQLEFLIAFDDHDPNYGFQLSPYALIVQEVEGESDAGNQRRNGFEVGTLIELGIRPEFELLWIANRPVTLAVPAKVGLSLNDYFEDPDGQDETFGYVDIGVEASYPVLMARSDGDRRFAVNLNVGLNVLFLGDSAQDISVENGTGGDSVELIGKLAVTMDY